MAIGAHTAQYAGAVWAEGRRVRARMCGQCGDARTRVWVPYLDCTVPTRREERVLGHEVPVHREDLTCVFLPRLHGELGECDVEELDRAVAACSEDLVLMRF